MLIFDASKKDTGLGSELLRYLDKGVADAAPGGDFKAEEHPRGAKGSGKGGQFVKSEKTKREEDEGVDDISLGNNKVGEEDENRIPENLRDLEWEKEGKDLVHKNEREELRIGADGSFLTKRRITTEDGEKKWVPKYKTFKDGSEIIWVGTNDKIASVTAKDGTILGFDENGWLDYMHIQPTKEFTRGLIYQEINGKMKWTDEQGNSLGLDDMTKPPKRIIDKYGTLSGQRGEAIADLLKMKHGLHIGH